MPIKQSPALFFYAGANFQAAYFCDVNLGTDTLIATQEFVIAPGDTFFHKSFNSWNYYVNVIGRQLNLPLGVRYQPAAEKWRWLQLGVNLAPGFTFGHGVTRVNSRSQYTIVVNSTGQQLERAENAQLYPSPEISLRKIPGNFFTVYASQPVHASFRPTRKLQFSTSMEPGYALTRIGRVSKSNVVTRISVGLRYRFSMTAGKSNAD